MAQWYEGPHTETLMVIQKLYDLSVLRLWLQPI